MTYQIQSFVVRCTQCMYESLRMYDDTKCSKCGGLVDVLLEEDLNSEKYV